MQQLKLLCCAFSIQLHCVRKATGFLCSRIYADFSFDMMYLCYHCIGLNWSGWCDQIVAITMYYI